MPPSGSRLAQEGGRKRPSLSKVDPNRTMAGKGQPKTGGRQKGTPNQLNREIRELIGEALDRAESRFRIALRPRRST